VRTFAIAASSPPAGAAAFFACAETPAPTSATMPRITLSRFIESASLLYEFHGCCRSYAVLEGHRLPVRSDHAHRGRHLGPQAVADDPPVRNVEDDVPFAVAVAERQCDARGAS